MKNKRLNELLNLKDELMNKKPKHFNEKEIKLKYFNKMKDMQNHYEAVISELAKEINRYKRSTLKQTNNTVRGNGMKSTRDFIKQSKTRLNSASYSPFGHSYDNTCNEEVDENDLIPAEELSITDRRKMNEKAENINNESVLRNFYKKKIESSQGDEFELSIQWMKTQNQDEYKHAQNSNEFIKSNDSKEKQNLQHSMMSLASKYNKITTKSKEKLIETQESSKSLSKFGNPSHKRTKSYNLNSFNKQNQSTDSKCSVQFMLNKSENMHNDTKTKRK